MLRAGALQGEEQVVYNTIRSSGNEGIWTKHLKSKTNLHEAVIKRCLRALEQKALVKAIKSVKHPTRKLYMLMELTPSVEVTGGPWFTDQELDVDFVEQLTNQCYKYILMKVSQPVLCDFRSQCPKRSTDGSNFARMTGC